MLFFFFYSFLGGATSATRIRRRRRRRTSKKYYGTRSTLNTTDSSTYVTWRCRKVAADAARNRRERKSERDGERVSTMKR